MKRIYTTLFLFLLGFGAIAQQNQEAAKRAKEIKSATFWGVDFSLAKFCGVANSKSEIYNSLWPINYLFIGEAKKYNVGKFFKKEISVDLSVIEEKTKMINKDELIVSNSNYKISNEQLSQLIKELQLPESTGVGLIFVGEMMNKIKEEASYHVVFFDNESREILFTKKTSGKVGGFGLRNFWARSVLDVMERWKYKP